MSLLPTLEFLGAGGAAVHGPLVATLEYRTTMPPESVASILDAVSTYLAAGAAGGFRGGGPGTTRSTLALQAAPVQNPTSIELALDLDNVAPLSFQYLRNLIGRLDLGLFNVARVLVREQRPSSGPIVQLPPVSDENEGDLYPPAIDPQPFLVTWAEGVGGKHRRFLVELAREVTVADVERATALAEPWRALLEGGAFALPVGYPADIESVMGAVSQFDAYAIEIDVPVFRASEVAWDVLANLLATGSSARALSVAEVTIE